METKTKFCDICHLCIVNNDGTTVRSALHLVKGIFDMYACVECCQAGKHKSFENDGFIQSGYKLAPDGA